MKLAKLENNAYSNAVKATFDKASSVISRVSPFGAGMNHDEIHEQAYEWMDEIKSPGSIFTSPICPPDLRKSQTRTIRSKTGKLISGLTLAEDWAHGSDSGLKTIPLALMLGGVISTASLSTGMDGPAFAAAVGLGLYRLAGAGFTDLLMGALLAGGAAYATRFAGGNESLIGAATFLLPAAFIYLHNYLSKKTRANNLLNQSRHHTNTLGDDEKILKQMEQQIIQAAKDDAKAPFLKIAIATGIMQFKGSFSSPDKGTEIGMNLSDLAQHIFVMGKPGTGKSYTLRKIIKTANEASIKIGKKLGMLLMDGKGELAFECRKILDLIIHPRFVEDYCLVDGVNATKWTSIMQAVNNAKAEGANAEFIRAALELVYNTALAHQYLKDMAEIDPHFSMAIGFEWNYMFRYNLMNKLLQGDYTQEVNGKTQQIDGLGRLIAQQLSFHPDFGTDPRLEQLIISIEAELSPERQEFAMKYLKTAQGYMQIVMQEENIIKWAKSTKSSVDILDCLKGKKVGIPLPPERFGLAGAFVTQLSKAKVRNAVANRENNWRDDLEATEIMMVQDEFQDIFSEFDDLNNIPKDRSRGCYNVIATQTVSAIYSKISNPATADYLFANFASFISFKTADKRADELMQAQCGTTKSFKVVTHSGKAIAFRETARDLVSRAEFDPTHPDAAMFKKFRTDVSFQEYDPQNKPNSVMGQLTNGAFNVAKFAIFGPIAAIFNLNGRHTQYYSTYQKDEKQDYVKVLSDDMFGELDIPQRAVCVLKRGGQWVRDIAIMQGVDPNFADV